MAANYGKGARGKATKLHSVYVRARANHRCQNCGAAIGEIGRVGNPVKQLHCAHIITRHIAATRTDENNAVCLCASCHFYMGKWPVEFAELVYSIHGKARYRKVLKKAKAGIGKKVDWDSEVDRLNKLIAGLGK